VLPQPAKPLIARLSVACHHFTFPRFILRTVGAVLAMGRRTVTAIGWTVRWLMHGHVSNYPRVFSRLHQGRTAGGGGLLSVRWVLVDDLDGPHRDESFYRTEADLKPAERVSLFTERWSMEVTFHEIRGETDKGS